MRRLRRQEGFTIIEGIVAAALIAIGIGAIISVFPVFHRQTATSQREEVAATVADKTLEEMTTIPWSKLVLASQPAATEPGMSGTTKFSVDSSSVTPEQLCYPGASGCTTGNANLPAVQTFTEGGVSGTIYRYITWKDEQCVVLSGLGLPDRVTNLLSGLLNGILGLLTGSINTLLENTLHTRASLLCDPATQDMKRLSVAVQMNVPSSGGGPTKPVYMSTLVANPNQGTLDVGG